MRALQVGEDGTLALRDVPVPDLPAGWCLVRVRLAGICRTDLEIARGYMGFRGTLGHEVVGDVVKAPSAPEWEGVRVVAEINFGCTDCTWCDRGLARHCPTRTVMGILRANGALADFVTVPCANLHRVPDTVTDEQAVFVEPLAAAFEVLEQLGDVSGRRAIVLGDGKLGLLAAQVLRVGGASVRLIGRHPAKLQRAQAMGISTGAAPAGADLVVDATGSADGLRTALTMVDPRGTIVLKTTVAAPHQVDLSPAVINEVTVVGSRCGPFPPAVSALDRGSVSVVPLIDHVFGLDDAIAAFEAAGRSGVCKVIVRP